MSALLKSTVIRGLLGFVQVMGIVVVAATGQHWSQPLWDLLPDAVCSTAQAGLPDEAPYLAENDAAMQRMMSEMTVRPTGDIDRDFVSMMSPHHQGAIEMAQAVLRHGRNEPIRRLAQEIIVTQQQEIAAMRLAVGDPPTRIAISSARP